MHHGYTADSSRGTYAFMLAELLSVSAVAGLSVVLCLCPLFCGCVCCSQTEFEVRVGESAYWSLIEVP